MDPLAEKFPVRSSYEYTFSNPINLIDPTGMIPEDPPESAKTWKDLKRQLKGMPTIYQPISRSERILQFMGDRTYPEYTKSDLDFSYNFLRSLAHLSNDDGHTTAAMMLNHFLNNSGKSITYILNFLQKDADYRAAVQKNMNCISGKNVQVAASLAIGQSLNYTDKWDAQFTSSYGSELYYSSGTSTVTTSVNLTITRTGSLSFDVIGTISDYWHDTYDWIQGARAWVPDLGMVPDNFGESLEGNGRAKSFKMHNNNAKKN